MDKLLRNALELRREVEEFALALSQQPGRRSTYVPEGASGDILRQLDEPFDDGEPPPCPSELALGFDAAAPLVPIIPAFREGMEILS
jgi:hypothetical protein